MMIKKQSKVVLWSIIFWFIALLWVLPFYSSFSVAMKPMSEITKGNVLGFPNQFYWRNFHDAWEIGVKNYLLSSFIIVPISVLGALFLSSLGAYSLSRYDFKGSNLILTIFLFFNLLPPQMNLIPVYQLSKALKIYDTYWAVILYHVSFQTGFCTFFLRNFMKTIPTDIFDAARIEGCTEFRLYWKIALPLSITAMAALGILEFTWIWNDFIWGMVLIQRDAIKPVTVGIQNLQAAYIQSWGMENAGALIAIIPTVLVFLFLRRYFIEGLTGGYGLS